jgi:hypothetical protein
LHKGKNIFDCEYGKYNARIYVKGYEDVETTFTINDSNNTQEIRYSKSLSSATVNIKNVSATDFIITIKNENGYVKTYHNISTFSAPNGHNELEIYCDGYTLKHFFTATKNETYEVDFAAEMKRKQE